MKRTRKKIYSTSDYKSPSGMLTRVWGPSLWFFLHTVSFNYPENPTEDDKRNYHNFFDSLKHVLPCEKCKDHYKQNIQKFVTVKYFSKILKIFSI